MSCSQCTILPIARARCMSPFGDLLLTDLCYQSVNEITVRVPRVWLRVVRSLKRHAAGEIAQVRSQSGLIREDREPCGDCFPQRFLGGVILFRVGHSFLFRWVDITSVSSATSRARD